MQSPVLVSSAPAVVAPPLVRYLSVVRAAEAVGISLRQMRRLLAEKEGPPYSRIRRRLVIAEADLAAWVAARRVA